MQDKLDDVLPFVPMSCGMEQLLDEVTENMDQDEPATKSAPPAKSSSVAKHTPPAMSDLATNSSTVAGSDLVVKPASLVTKPSSLTTSTSTPEVDKKRSSGAINDKDVGITAKKPRTSASGTCIIPPPPLHEFSLDAFLTRSLFVAFLDVSST